MSRVRMSLYSLTFSACRSVFDSIIFCQFWEIALLFLCCYALKILYRIKFSVFPYYWDSKDQIHFKRMKKSNYEKKYSTKQKI